MIFGGVAILCLPMAKRISEYMAMVVLLLIEVF